MGFRKKEPFEDSIWEEKGTFFSEVQKKRKKIADFLWPLFKNRVYQFLWPVSHINSLQTIFNKDSTMAKSKKKSTKKEPTKFEQLEKKMHDALALKKDGTPGARADVSEAVGVLSDIVAEISADSTKFDGDKMNKTAGTRIRKYLMLVKKSSTSLRAAVQEKKNKAK